MQLNEALSKAKTMRKHGYDTREIIAFLKSCNYGGYDSEGDLLIKHFKNGSIVVTTNSIYTVKEIEVDHD